MAKRKLDDAKAVISEGSPKTKIAGRRTPNIAPITQEKAVEMFRALEKVIGWLDRLATNAEREARNTRFVSLVEAYTADAKNYRATANDLKRAIAGVHNA